MMRKSLISMFTALLLITTLQGCANNTNQNLTIDSFEGTTISLSDKQILVNGETPSTDSSSAVYIGESIVYYEEGKDSSYGEGSASDAHSSEEANKHTVITITQPGNYQVTGSISYGQIAINLGDGAKKDENAVVNLTLNNVEITNTVAPAIVVYNAYECGSDDTATATKDVDTSKAGFNLIIADDSINTINGSYVAKIYEEGTTNKLHKYDAAIDSKRSFTINGEEKGNGILTVNAENEGISSNLHLTINGGNITINSSDDAINTNEDGVSVLTINGGTIICDSGLGKEGDGIDSNGWIVINGGYLVASANGQSQDSGLDSDKGTYINGGVVLGSGNMYDEVSKDSSQKIMVFSFNSKLSEDDILLIKDSNDNPVVAFSAVNSYSTLVYSSDTLVDGDYTLYKVTSVEGENNGGIYTNITSYKEAVQLAYSSQGMSGMGGRPMGGNRGTLPDGFDPSQRGERPQRTEGEAPKDFDVNQMPTDRPEMPNGEKPSDFDPSQKNQNDMTTQPTMQVPEDMNTQGTQNPIFTLSNDSYTFSGISEYIVQTENKEM